MRADVLIGPSPWMVDRLGGAVADEVWTRIPEALSAAIRRTATARDSSRMSSDHVFANPRWATQYEELAARLWSLDGSAVVRSPHGAYQLVVLNGHVIVPWCYGPSGAVGMQDVRPTRSFGRLLRELLRRFGPSRPWAQPDQPLLRDELDERDVAQLCSALTRVAPAPRILIAGYACSSAHGLLRVGLGEASLGAGGTLVWHRTADLPLPPPVIPRPRGLQFP